MKFYRYDIVRRVDGMDRIYGQPVLSTFNLVKETPKGYWIDVWMGNKWVSKYGKRRYAYPTKEEAIQSCIARTNKRISYCRRDLRVAESGLRKLEELSYE